MEAKQSAESVAGGLLGRPLMISQIAVVVNDLEKTMEQYTKLLGWGPWNVYRHEPPRLHERWSAARASTTRCSAPRPTSATWASSCCSRWRARASTREWLDQHGEGLHHVAVMLHDFDESTQLKQRFDQVGASVLMGGRIGETIEFYYLDTEPSLKIIIESGSGHAIDLVPDYVYP